MRLIRFGSAGSERPGLLDAAGARRDVSAHVQDWNAASFRSGAVAKVGGMLADPAWLNALPQVAADQRWGAPIARPGKIVCVGLNYSDHARESGMAIPAEPILFLKASQTVIGPYDQVSIPRGSTKTDWEVELGVVLGADVRYLESEAEAEAAIAGYCISHDVSERAFQLERGGQWTKGKSCDTFNPLGPVLVTPNDLPDPANLAMSLAVNGTPRQTGTTSTMIFNVPSLIVYISQFMTLEAGDLISTGTPPGVGLGLKPPQYLRAGDIVELEIAGLGKQRQEFIQG